MVLVGHWTAPSELGSYSIAFSLLASLFCIQESLISFPYTVYRSSGMPAEQAGSSLAHNGQLSILAVAALAAVAISLSAADAVPHLVAAMWVLAGAAPFILLREFGRRFAFAHLRMAQALTLDLAVAAVQLAGLCWLGWSGRMSAAAACATLGAACGVAGIVWLHLPRSEFQIRGKHVWTTMKQSWGLGKWLLAGQLSLWARAYVAYWLLAWIAGTAATGVYAACVSIVSFANPLILGFSNVLAPRAVLALSEGGTARLLRETIRDTLLIGGAMGLFVGVVVLTGEDIMRFLYRGKEYEGQGNTLTVLALALLVSAVGMPASNALASLERPRGIFWNALVALFLTMALVFYLADKWGQLGAAYGFLAGNVANSLGRLMALLTCVQTDALRADVARSDWDSVLVSISQVLQHLTPNAKEGGWVIEALGEGFEAHVYAVRSQNQRPIWQTHRALVIKLYKPTTLHFQSVREQFESLSRLHSAVDSDVINGWKILAPAPLYLCKSPLAIVMTMVSGTKLEWCLLTGDDITLEVLESAPRAIAHAMMKYWSLGYPYGELNLRNMLCDIDGRKISFIDSGVRDSSHIRDDVAARWCSAARDIGYLLYDAGATLAIGNRGARRRKQMFTDQVLRAFIETVGTPEAKQQFINEIEACVQGRLGALDPSWSLRGLWQAFIKTIAVRRIDAILVRLRAQ
jgi:O-antigen/teichoic acid export membrane protein